MNEGQLREMLAGRAQAAAPQELMARIEAIPTAAAIPATNRWLPSLRPQRRVFVMVLVALVLLASLLAAVIGSQLITRPLDLPGNGVIVVPDHATLWIVDPATGKAPSAAEPFGVPGLESHGHGDFGESNGVAWSPDGRSLAGFNRGDLKVIDVRTGEIRTLARLQGCQLSVAPCDLVYSPDSRTIAVTNGVRLHLVDVATGAVKHLRTDHEPIGSPTWSPDSRTVAVSVGGTFEVLDLTGVVVGGPFESHTRLGLAGLSWSPDGTRLGYIRLEGGDLTNNIPSDILLVTVRPDATDERVIARIGSCFCLGFGPLGFTWSPDGRQIAFVTLGMPGFENIDAGGLYVAHADGTGVRLIREGINGGVPAWQPIR